MTAWGEEKIANFTKWADEKTASGIASLEGKTSIGLGPDLTPWDIFAGTDESGNNEKWLPATDPMSKFHWVSTGVDPAELFVFNFRLILPEKELKTGTSLGTPPNYRNVVFVLPLNPVKETRTQAKNITYKLTDGGYVATNWGSAMIKLTFTGTTGRLIPEDEYTVTQASLLGLGVTFPDKPVGIRDTMAWKTFMKFNYYFQYFNGGNEYNWVNSIAGKLITPRTALIRLEFFDKVYVGTLQDFGFDVDAESPWQIKYHFTFEAFPILETIGARTSLS